MATKAAETRLIGYARVSTEDQQLDLQINALKAAGVFPDNLHCEKLSARSQRRHRLDLAIKSLRPGDTLVVWRLDRLARSMRDLYDRLDQIAKAGASFRSLNETFDFSSTTGRFVLGILGLVAELERQIIADRTAAGIAAWRQRGGIPGAKRKLDDHDVKRARAMLKKTKIGAKGRNVHAHTRYEVAKSLGVSVTTLRNYGI